MAETREMGWAAARRGGVQSGVARGGICMVAGDKKARGAGDGTRGRREVRVHRRHGTLHAHAAMIVAFFVLLGAATTPRVPPLRAARPARMGATSATTSVPAPPFHYHRRLAT